MAIALAWLAGEFIHRWTSVPRISVYGLVGFAVAQAFPDLYSSDSTSPVTILANVAFGLILFEFGYRVNLHWLRVNPWIALTGIVESAATFAVVYAIGHASGMPPLTSALLASLAMSTSPAGVLRVINEQNSSGQVTERVLHLVAINCVLALFVFKVVVGVWVFRTSGSLTQAMSHSAIELLASAVLGTVAGVVVPAVLRQLGQVRREGSIAFVLAVLLFVFAVTTLDWDRVAAGAGLAVVLLLARFVVKTVAVAAFARPGGVSWRKGALTGVALAPMSVFVILLLEQTRNMGIVLVDELAARWNSGCHCTPTTNGALV